MNTQTWKCFTICKRVTSLVDAPLSAIWAIESTILSPEHLLFASSSLRVPARGGAGDADQATEGAARLPARVHRRARLRAHARRDRAALRTRLAGDRAQAPDQPRAEGTHPAAREPQPCARADGGAGRGRRGRRPPPPGRGGGR